MDDPDPMLVYGGIAPRPVEPTTQTPTPQPAAPVAARQAAPKITKIRVGLKIDAALYERAKSAVIFAGPVEGVLDMSQLVETLLRNEVTRLETQYNNGQPWPAAKLRNDPRT